MHVFVTLLPLFAAALGVPQFAPQIARVRPLDHAAGVSWPWAALTCVNNIAWFGYFILSRFWTSLVPSGAVAILSGALAVMLARRTPRVPRRSAALVLAWAVVLAVLAVLFGRIVLGTGLAVAFVIQVTPSVWLAAKSSDMTAASRGTWLLICGEQLSWGLFGVFAPDVRLLILGVIGVAASLFLLARIPGSGPTLRAAQHPQRPSSITAPVSHRPPHAAEIPKVDGRAATVIVAPIRG